MRVSRVQNLTAAADAPIVAAGLDDRTVQIWNWDIGERLAEFMTVFQDGGHRLALHHNGDICVAASWKKGKRDGIACYDTRSGQIVWHRADLRQIQGLRFSPSGDGVWCRFHASPAQRLDANTGETSAIARRVQQIVESPYSSHRLEVRSRDFLIKGERDFSVPRLTFALLDAAFGGDALCLTESGGPVRCVTCASGMERWRFQPIGGAHVLALSFSQIDRSFYGVQWDTQRDGTAVLLRISEETGDALEICRLNSGLACVGGGVVVTSTGEVVSLGGDALKQLPFPEREYPDPPPPVTEPLLHFAVRFGTEKTIRNLIASGFDVNLRGDDGCTALHIAAARGRLDAVRILLELGADPNRKNASGETAAQTAERVGQSEIARILVGHSELHE